jgi:hypothetical protein
MVTIKPENLQTLEDLLDVPIEAPKDAKHYRIRAALAYCKERGISIEDISDEELKQFECVPV